jgi:hypothetical protein
MAVQRVYVEAQQGFISDAPIRVGVSFRPALARDRVL